jgi:hypothetical protein
MDVVPRLDRRLGEAAFLVSAQRLAIFRMRDLRLMGFDSKPARGQHS